MKLDEITSVIAEHVRTGELVVRLHSENPVIYGSIVGQMASLEATGIHADIVPGVSSMFGAAAALRTEYTLRGVSESRSSSRGRRARLWTLTRSPNFRRMERRW